MGDVDSTGGWLGEEFGFKVKGMIRRHLEGVWGPGELLVGGFEDSRKEESSRDVEDAGGRRKNVCVGLLRVSCSTG